MLRHYSRFSQRNVKIKNIDSKMRVHLVLFLQIYKKDHNFARFLPKMKENEHLFFFAVMLRSDVQFVKISSSVVQLATRYTNIAFGRSASCDKYTYIFLYFHLYCCSVSLLGSLAAISSCFDGHTLMSFALSVGIPIRSLAILTSLAASGVRYTTNV